MTLLERLAAWISDPANWQGADGIPARVGEHVAYAVGGTLLAALIALPLGVWLGHRGHHGNIVISVANIGRAVPTFVLILLLFYFFPFNLGVIFAALVALGIPPILTNAYVGVRQVDPEVRDAALGQGLDEWQLLRQVEIPIALPLLMSGLRTSAVTIVATAGLAAVASFGGLGRYVIDGIAIGVRGRAAGLPEVIWGALLIAALAVGTELLLGALQRRLTPRGLRARAVNRREDPLRPAV